MSSECIYVYFVVRNAEKNLGDVKTGISNRGDMKIKIKSNGFTYSNEVYARIGLFLKISVIIFRYYIRALNFLNTIIKLQLFKITICLFIFTYLV